MSLWPRPVKGEALWGQGEAGGPSGSQEQTRLGASDCGKKDFSDHRIINPHNHLSLFSKTSLILFQSRYKYSTCWFTPQTCTAARAGLKGGVSAGSPAYGAEALTHAAPSAGRELAGQAKQLGCDPAPIWDTGAARDGGSSFVC